MKAGAQAPAFFVCLFEMLDKVIDSIYQGFFVNKIGIPVDLLAIDYDRYLELNNEIGYI